MREVGRSDPHTREYRNSLQKTARIGRFPREYGFDAGRVSIFSEGLPGPTDPELGVFPGNTASTPGGFRFSRRDSRARRTRV